MRLSGTPGAPGIAVAAAWRYAPPTAGAAAVAGDISTRERLEAAADEAVAQLDALAAGLRAAGLDEEAGILEAQGLMATDPALLGEAMRTAELSGDPAAAIRAAGEAAAGILAAVDDPIVAARAADVRDVAERMARILSGTVVRPPDEPSVVLAEDVPASLLAELPRHLLAGLALEGGTATAHCAILARAMGIPAVVGVRGLLAAAEHARQVAIDGARGELVLDPDESETAAVEARRAEAAARDRAAAALRGCAGATADGRAVRLVANIGGPADVPRALAAGAEGVGLFRTEFLFLGRSRAPSEEEQLAAYRGVLEAFGPGRPVVIRLADIGGDKALPYLDLAPEQNPFLGVRAIRLAYSSRELLLTQLRAISRAGAAAGVTPHVMAPMIATLADVDLFDGLRAEAQASLEAHGLAASPALVWGIMVEVPAAVFLATELARRVGFFSIGTNDLTQYLLAADRTNPALAHLHDALQPAVLRAVAQVVAAADAAGIEVAVCGELAGDPAGALVLAGLGVDELSADAGSLDSVRLTLSRVTSAEIETLAGRALAATDAARVRALAGELLERDATPAR
ncbi:MAG TPA: phosphoenolpyruvate--protein phosphotransferase [Candidatus Limnocylindrales bacterium]|nr:phosphoenolpyruvate--protein phosphotransferase [Candidatus Limnocylindrales bacterium]